MFIVFLLRRRGNFKRKDSGSNRSARFLILGLCIIGILSDLTESVRVQDELISSANHKSEQLKPHQNLSLQKGNYQEITIKFFIHDITLSVGEERNIIYTISGLSRETPQNITIEIEFNSSNSAILNDLPSSFIELSNHSQEMELSITSKASGYTVLTGFILPPNMPKADITEAYLRVHVHHLQSLDYLSEVVGWIYFIVWSVSFYPQTWLNWRRKSVIGLHFDFLSLNIIGFLLYSIFNIGLYFIPEIQREYRRRHPFGINPVQLNDVIFSIHAFFACIIQVIQCIIYERGDQKISRTGRSLIGSFTVISIIVFILGSTSVIVWLDFLYFLSYIKLTITLIKYIPQAYYNYIRKSTSGWSIGNVLLDFTGGAFSICQMMIISYNYNDWGSIFGDPTKFGLGFISLVFDIFFMVQHYSLYKVQENYLFLPESLEHSNSDVYSQSHENYGSTTGNY